MVKSVCLQLQLKLSYVTFEIGSHKTGGTTKYRFKS
jgi:hypothetical protein